jgi:hypothetical protein
MDVKGDQFLVNGQRLKVYYEPDVVPLHHIDVFTMEEEPNVNTKHLYRKGTDLWAEFGNKMPFGKKNLLGGFGKDACGR